MEGFDPYGRFHDEQVAYLSTASEFTVAAQYLPLAPFQGGYAGPQKANLRNRQFKLQNGIKFDCPVCELTCGGPQQYNDHLKGQKHLKKEARFNLLSQFNAHLSGSPSVATTSATVTPPTGTTCITKEEKVDLDKSVDFTLLPNGHYYCSICDISCTSFEPYKLHVSGSKHKKNFTRSYLRKMTCKVSKDENKLSEASEENQVNTTDAAQSDVLGEEFIKEIVNDKGVVKLYTCELCSCKMCDLATATSHLKGRKHRQNYKMKIDSTIKVLPRSVKRTEKIRRAKLEKKQAKEEFWREKDQYNSFTIENSYKQRSDNTCLNNYKISRRPYSLEDLYMVKKFESIEMDSTILHNLLWLTNCCENALKIVSDELMENDIKSQNADIKEDESANNASQEVDDRKRILKGVKRVGILFSGQIMKEDDRFRLILMTTTKPTLSLLEKIYLSFPLHLRSIIDSQPDGEKFDFEVVMVPEEACLVTQILTPHSFQITISLTSPTVEHEDSNEKITTDSLDLLNKESCLDSLQQLRRSKWFQVRASSLSEGIKVMKVLRHLRLEDEVWSYISEWANELLIEKCSFIQGEASNLSDILRCYFQVLSSGILLGGPGLKDPCEKQPIDLLEGLSVQQREDLTARSQKCLRLLVYRQIYKVLNLPEMSKNKRKLDDGSDCEPEEKKPRVEDQVKQEDIEKQEN